MTPNNNNSRNKQPQLETKTFSERESLITELLEVKHFKILKHSFLALLFGFLAKDLLQVLLTEKSANFGFTTLRLGFANFHHSLWCWIILFGIHLLTYPLFKCWALKRIELKPKSAYLRRWDRLFLFITIIYDISCIFIFPLYPYKYLNLGIASSFVVLLENIRFVMKSHAFIRRSSADVVNYKPHDDKKLELPTFRSYLYFSFAPTILYRREYPRTKNINYGKALGHFLEVLCAIWLQAFIGDIFFRNQFHNVGKQGFDMSVIPVAIFESTLGGGLLLLINFYLVLHAWCNGFAELLRFADRRFYEDWWVSTNYSTYFRRWNIVIQDWLFEYVYKDFYEYIIPENKTAAKWVVFLLSAAIHEQIIVFSTGHFLPILFIQFLGGAVCSSLRTKHPVYNIFMLYSFALGNTIQISLHTIEYYARKNCPYPTADNSTSFVPRFITLDCV